MDHEDCELQDCEQVPETVEIVGYAAELASSLVKESIEESGREEQEGQWSIPCSKDCHSDRHETSGQCAGSGQLCWTPESTVSLDTMDTAQSREAGLCKTGEESENVMLRKGASVPNVSCDDQDQDSQHSKSQKRSFLRTLGLGGKTGSDGLARPGHKMRSLRKTLSSLFRRSAEESATRGKTAAVPPGQRALPPVPARQSSQSSQETPQATENNLELREGPEGGGDQAEEQQADNLMDFAASIEKVKDRGWYWGPLSGEAAERILSGEPDGSFVVRDSSDQHYIFSLTFKLNGFVRHVRIEHDQGNFSFGSFTRFKSHTIVDFIENAVEHSRSGRYLFFLHRRPVLGPMRVQLLHPVSRFKRVQSLQHLCRYVIVKVVRKDHLDQLPVPSRIKSYLNTPFYYSEQVTGNEDSAQSLEDVEETPEETSEEAETPSVMSA